MNKLQIVMYHYVRDLQNSRYPDIHGLDYKTFKEQICFLKNNFNIITMEKVVEAIDGKEDLPENALILTFDDGYIDHYTYVFPILLQEQVQGSFFIPGKTFTEHKLLDVNKIHFVLASTEADDLVKELFTQMDFYRGKEFDIPSNKELFEKYAVGNRFDNKETVFVKRILQTGLPEKLRNIIAKNIFEKYVGISEEKFAHELYMNHEQIKTMKNAGMYIGIHGYDHYWLANLSEKEMKEDIDRALKAMTDFINPNAWVMNYPYGSYNNVVKDYIEGKGCKLGLCTEVRTADIRLDNRYCLPRWDTNDYPPRSNNYLKGAK